MTKWKILMTLLVLCIGGGLIWYWVYQENEREQLRSEEKELGMYTNTAALLYMEIDYRGYEQGGNVDDISLNPTEQTDTIIERWEAVSEAFPTIQFPQKQIEEEDWVEVYLKFLESEGEMLEVIETLSANLPEGEDLGGLESLYIFVRNGVIREGNFEKLLKEKEIIK
ncbi:hypothetical protein CAY60_004695 [Shouchella clausii]|uniref:Uncharacterized protein n=2 Tax=Shouchella clausii TaxID=79880 RepID=Q5WK68_SHOC1|nr:MULTISPECIES: hypothetical protein [Shouchella]SPU21304.1 Uncharacterised protein [Niallia circulans]KKI86903.1 hypothetical protein WZ76_08230 [Shouchella clausii]MBU3230406.1 hypothetical protein [Shouchella clausii]MBU3262395.1 hypothetical protein [Shouchella clausii]MBU3507290.1 hypothetical protein [Shouchella clausii]